MTKCILIGFEFENEEKYKDAMNIAKFYFNDENEDFEHCVSRERGKEVLICQENNFPYVVFLKNSERIIDSNVDMDTLDVSQYQLFLRTRFKNKSHYFGIKRISEKENNVTLWPNNIKNKMGFLKRKVNIMSNAEFKSVLSKKQINPPFFIKTVNKAQLDFLTLHHAIKTQKDMDKIFGQIDTVSYFEDNLGNVRFNIISPDWFCPYRDMMIKGSIYSRSTDDDFIISDVIDIEKEYRCYIIHNEVSSISEYNDYISTEIPKEVSCFAKQFANIQITGNLPDHYVLDVAKLTNGDVVMVELNNISNSGRYFDNDPYKLYKDLVGA
jgi:hypothetical protein